MLPLNTLDNRNEIRHFRILLCVAGGVYLLWWFGVELFLPNSFNPWGSRLAVVSFFFGTFAASFASARARRLLPTLYHAGLWALTAHYHYLFLGNNGDNNWVIGDYITLLAITYAFTSPSALFAYSFFVAAMSAALLIALPSLQTSNFFPGALTILLQANIGLRTRFRVLKRVEGERARATAMQEKMRAMDEFISLASHELKTPLTSMKLWNQLLRREIEKKETSDGRRVIEIVGLMEHQINRLTGLVETMLTASQAAGVELRLDRQPVEVVTLLKSCVARLRPQSERLGASLTIESADNHFVLGDSERLVQAFDNILANALKYGNRKPVRISIRREGHEVVTRITDQGPGISPEHLERIFDRFERVDGSRQMSGLGLGLYLVRAIVVAHGGTVTAESMPGEGATFTVRLPARPA